MAGSGKVAVLGAGAMGTALAVHMSRAGVETVLLATDRDGPIVDAWRRGAPHPALQVPFAHLPCVSPDYWPGALADAQIVLVAVSSGGLAPVLARAAPDASPAVWALATKGWESGTLRRPSEVVTAALGPVPVVAITGPALAAEIAVGAPTGLLLASRDQAARREVAAVLAGPSTVAFTTSDLIGAETAAAFKNVVAVAVGLAEGLAARFTESAVPRAYANARAAVFARGVLDMAALVEAQGGRVATVLGLAGSGDLYVTCGHGRNGRFGRLLGEGTTVDAAIRSIGSTVEGVANTAVALELAARAGLDLPSARIVDQALRAELTDDLA
ncbi:MAG: NAD(P)H-dependent glycerol-3-phosphate dehydrogenase, partial [Blastococcus sp.]